MATKRRTSRARGLEGTADYRRRLKEEASFWDARAERLRASGRIPLWFDHRRGQDVSSIPLGELRGAGIRANPALYSAVYGQIIDRIVGLATARRGRALDLGCGAGWFSLELARGGMSVDGLDIGPRQIAIARRMSRESRQSADPRWRGDFGRTSYRVADLNAIRLPRSRYDVAVALGTLHHIQNLDRLLCETARSLRSGGRFIFWEYVGYAGLARVFPALFKAAGRLARPWRLLRNKDRVVPTASPFEGASQAGILEAVRRRFRLESAESRFLFLPVIVTRLRIYRLPPLFSLPLTRALEKVDRGLIRSGLFRGPFVLGVARRTGRERSPGA
jgi:SAM-dependent methyltransferase